MAKLFQRTCPEMVGGCFIAGTLVHTDKGLVPIEQIKIGDRVLSQPEETGERAYKRVVNTFAFEDKAVWVVKYSMVDPAPGSMHHRMIYHLYATDNHPFWVHGRGWIAAKYLRIHEQMQLASGELVRVVQIWPVVRTPVEGLGWVSSDILDSPYGIEEQGHIVDFRDGCNLWQYHLLREAQVERVPHYDGMFYNDPEAPFLGEDLYDIYVSDDPLLKTRVYNLEVEDFHTYYVGELGVWVHNRDCLGLELLNPAQGAKVPDSSRIFAAQGRLGSFINRFPRRKRAIRQRLGRPD